MLRYFIVGIILSFVNFAFSQLPTFQWASAMGGSQADEGRSVKLDLAGNVITTGYFQLDSDFNPGSATYSLSSFGMEDIFISKLDVSGNFLWAKQIGGKGNDRGLSIELDISGNIYVTGFFSDTTDFDPGPGTFTLVSYGSNDIFISKLDNNGNFIWAKKMGGSGDEQSNSIDLDMAGNIYINGYFNNTVDFDPGAGTFTMISNGMEDIFVAKLNPSGNFAWAKQMGGIQSDQALSMVVDASGNVNSAGYFNDVVDFDSGLAVSTLTSNGGKDVFYSKLDASGNFVWGLGFGSYTDDVCYSIALDASGNLLTTGSYSGYCDFDPGPSSYMVNYSGGTSSIFISKLDAGGNLVWAFGMNSYWANEGRSIYADAVGNIYTAGVFSNSIDFDPGSGTYYLTPTPVYFGPNDIYVAKYTSTGNFVWARNFGSSFSETCGAITVDMSENIYITGSFPFSVDFDPGLNTFSITSNSNSGDIFISKFGPCMATPGSPINTTLANDQIICSSTSATLSASGAGTIYWYATPSGTSIIGSGTVFVTPSLTTGTYTYYALAATCTISPRTPLTVTVNACVGINEQELNISDVKIFPNPNNGSFTLKIESEIKNTELIIYNSLGQKVFEQKIISGENIIMTKNLAPGLYHAVLSVNEGQNSVCNLVIE